MMEREHKIDGVECMFSALKKAHDSVSHICQSLTSKEKVNAAQQRVNKTGSTLTVIQDVRTRWLSTHMV
jgi:hypothetical protein